MKSESLSEMRCDAIIRPSTKKTEKLVRRSLRYVKLISLFKVPLL